MDASQSVQEQNRALIEAVIERSGLKRLPPTRVAIERVEAVVEDAAVDVQLAVEGRSIRLRFSKRDDSQASFERTPSFNVVYICGQGERQLESAQTATLNWTIQRLGRFDPGTLTLSTPPLVRPRGLNLPMVKSDELRERAWHRDLFDQSMATLLARGTRVRSLVIVVAQACEMNCAFCPTTDRVNIHFRPSGERWQFEDLLHQIARGRELGASEIDFGGNDVLRYPGILDLFQACGDAGYTRISAQSPGQIFADRAFAEAAAAGPLTHVAMPIYGTTAAVHDAITRKPGTFDGLLAALANIRELGSPRVELHTIALKSTLSELESLIAFSKETLGLPLRVSSLRSNRQGERTIVLDMASFSELRELIARYPEHFRIEYPPCQFPRERMKKRLESSPRGDRMAPLNLYDLGLPDGCEDAIVAMERKPTYPDRCEGCEAKFACGGVLGHYLDMFGDKELEPFTELGPYAPYEE